jgi:hypothetical protein
VDDIVVKTRKADDLVTDLRVAFDPEKCVFRLPRGMLLGYLVSQWGIM